MMTGFTFRGRHIRDVFSGIDGCRVTARTLDRPIIPEAKQAIADAANIDGSYDFSAANEYRRMFYSDRIFSVELSIGAPGIEALQKALDTAAVWLMGRGQLMFDDTPNAVWDAAVFDTIQYKPERAGTKAVIEAAFRVRPFAASNIDILRGVKLGDSVRLGFGVPLGGVTAVYNTWNVPAQGYDVKAVNAGTWYTLPKFTISPGEGGLDSIHIYLGTFVSTVNYSCSVVYSRGEGNKATNDIVIDFAKRTATNGGIDETKYLTTGGRMDTFFEIPPGEFDLAFLIPYGNAGAAIKMEYEPKYIYEVRVNA